MNESELNTVDAMRQYGGSFVKNLAECFRTADRINFVRLQNTFPEYWNQYADMAKHRAQEAAGTGLTREAIALSEKVAFSLGGGCKLSDADNRALSRLNE